ncbi:MAG TPA: TetR/AcrR family transcriptional regulator [Actinomycetes bacterium]|nr:TetR/AcrR family transcriptional regulator [Actinomycetes bacterium]
MTSAPSARGLRLPRTERRQQLLLAAQEVFVASGYHAAAMDDIATRAGVSKPVLYQHFPGKLELYLALLDASADSLVAAIKAALESTSDNGLRVEATVRAYFDYVSDDAGAFRLVFESDLTAEPSVRERVDRVNHACATAVSEVIAEDTGFNEEAAMLLAAGLTGAAQVAARWWLTHEGQLPRRAAEDLVSALSWRGISGFPRHEAAAASAAAGDVATPPTIGPAPVS